MKHIDVKPDSSAECNVDSNEKDPKFEIGSRVRISKYKKNCQSIYSKLVTRSFYDQ